MFLKRLESIGFKSFAERIQVEFVPGVTAVVGPNGSGKSNVIDAIRWVLGEQSAKSLRGQKMEDIIFQGSDTRKALNFAEVSLILNNENGVLPVDYQEVNVTRRVYRSGESEFLLNKQACRLKDIIDLFMDTGLGKESFSIIGQGRIDEILSSKAEERRAVFEEAAGVLKYKQRKKQAEVKLVDTADNLDRVEDILHEITQQIEPLTEQAETAEKYQSYQAKLRETEISLLVSQIEQLHGEWQQALREVEANEQTTLEKRTAIQKKEAALVQDREEIQQLEKLIAKNQQDLLEITEQLKQYEGERDVLQEKGKYEKENKEKLSIEAQSLKERLHQLENLKTKENDQLKEITHETARLQKMISSLEQKLSVTPEELDQTIEDLKADYIEDLNGQAITKNEMQRLEEQSDQLKVQLKEKQKTYHRSLADEKKLASGIQALTVTRDELKTHMETLETEKQAIQKALEQERKTLEDMQHKLSTGNEQIAKFASRKEMLEEMKDSYQGFYFGAKEILKAKDSGKMTDIFGAVIDLIHVPSQYMTAMETVLGAQAQYIVTANDAAARNSINWLKSENKGRATFLPLQSILPKRIPDSLYKELQHQPGFIGIASELIETAPAYNKLKAYLLGNVLVTETLQHANNIAKITNRKFRVVTLDGDIVYPGGSMAGGAKKQSNQSLFTREKEITTLAEKLQNFTQRAAAYEQKIEMQKNRLQQLEETHKETNENVEGQKEKWDHLQTELQELSIKYSRAKAEVQSYQTITEQNKQEQNDLKQKHAELLEKQRHIVAALMAKEEKIEQLSNQRKTWEQDEKTAENKLQEVKIKQAEQEERKKAIKERYDTLQKQLEEASHQLTQTEAALTSIMDEAERQQLEQTVEENILGLQEAKERISGTLHHHQLKREKITQKTRDDEHETKGMQQELHTLTTALQKKEVQANRLDVTIENHLNRLQSVYKMTYERARSEYHPVEDMKQASRLVEELHTAIERLGTVNLGAIDELERLREREDFLRTQQEDLLEAKATLYHIIREMDQEMTKQFTDVFEDIQIAFSEVFHQLFGGGHASLTLTDPEDILETGIEIAARPPGKKLKTLGLLSGGERALTAIALLFAILQVRPVPFCILDEVDAALDEANVERFGKYLRTFSQQTQFIVITHRKGTMEEADALYGITMQESGVSRLVSVKLEEAAPLMETT